MPVNITGLGKGLDALIRERQDSDNVAGLRIVPLEDISPNPRQPRRHFSVRGMEELAESISSQGLLQPLLVRPLGSASPGKYEIVTGERRWRACKSLGITEVPVFVRLLTEQDTLTSALIENLQREDLNPLEEALGLQVLKEEFGLSQDDLAKKIGKSRPYIANSLRLLSLPDSMRPYLADGRLSPGHARALLSLNQPQAQEKLRDLILERRLSVREAEGLVARWKENGDFAETAEENGGQAGATGRAEDRIIDSVEAGESGLANNGQADETCAEATSSGQATPLSRKKPQSAILLDWQTRISDSLCMPVRVTGRESKGRISFIYNSKEELEMFVNKIQAAQPSPEKVTSPLAPSEI
ncbi:MAG: ParB/RepB/Spo0J family partition protein [Desulfovibrio sp.]|jgi:ParB family chromosome partitioning protein|nr:ParB/RepB/Spo0J family partition protein [Desulfovibrio sp.]